MISLTFGTSDLANTRFAYSPLWEAAASYCVLLRTEYQSFHLPWLKEARAVVDELDPGLINLLLQPLPRAQGKFPYHADFLTPFPSSVQGNLESELEQLRATPPEAVRADIRRNYAGLPQEQFRPFLADPEAAMNSLADFLALYWDRALAHHWPRIRARLEADVLYRASILALHGPEALLDSLGPGARGASFAGRTLTLAKFAAGETHALAGHGLLLVPSVFVSSLMTLPWQEVLQYQVRGVAQLWQPTLPDPGAALSLLLGEARARLLMCLAVPATTTELARRFAVTPGAVSQQLAWLAQTGLVTTQRRGRQVYYEVSQIGRGLLEAYEERDDPTLLLASEPAPARRG